MHERNHEIMISYQPFEVKKVVGCLTQGSCGTAGDKKDKRTASPNRHYFSAILIVVLQVAPGRVLTQKGIFVEDIPHSLVRSRVLSHCLPLHLNIGSLASDHLLLQRQSL